MTVWIDTDGAQALVEELDLLAQTLADLACVAVPQSNEAAEVLMGVQGILNDEAAGREGLRQEVQVVADFVDEVRQETIAQDRFPQ